MKLGRITVTGGFVLLWGLLVYLDAGVLPAVCLLTSLLHEAGHWVSVLLCGGRVEEMELNAAGAVMRLSNNRLLSYAREILCVLMGPAVSLLSALIFCLLDGKIDFALSAAGLCLVQGLFNLLPAQGLDGGRALYLLLLSREHPHALRVVRTATIITAWVLAALCAAGFVANGYNAGLLMIGVFAITAMMGDFHESNTRIKIGRGAKTGTVHGR